MTTTSVRCLLALTIVALLVLTAAPARRAEASQGGLDVNTAALQMAICGLTGGTATYGEIRTVGQGLTTETVWCKGGLGGDWSCLTLWEFDSTECNWRPFRPLTGGPEGQVTTGGVVVDDPVDNAPMDAPVAPVLVDEVVEDEPVVEEPVVEDEPISPVDGEEDGGSVDEPAGHDLSGEVATDEPVADGDPVDEPAGHDLGGEVATDEPVVIDPVVDPLVVDPLVDPALMDAEVAAEPAVDGDSFAGE